MRAIVPYIFWPWFAISVTVLIRRRVGGSSWFAKKPREPLEPIAFPPPPPNDAADPGLAPAPAPVSVPAPDRAPDPPPARAPESAPTNPTAASSDGPSRSLAEALEGITMPCDLAPLMGSGTIDPRLVVFFTKHRDSTVVLHELAAELERLGYRAETAEGRTIRAERGLDVIRAKMMSADLDSEPVLREVHPSAPPGALVVEVKLT